MVLGMVAVRTAQCYERLLYDQFGARRPLGESDRWWQYYLNVL
jgi:hypothetical protein